MTEPNKPYVPKSIPAQPRRWTVSETASTMTTYRKLAAKYLVISKGSTEARSMNDKNRVFIPKHLVPPWEVDIGNSTKGRFLWGTNAIYFQMNPEKITDGFVRTTTAAVAGTAETTGVAGTPATPATTTRLRTITFQLLVDSVFTISYQPMGPGKRTGDTHTWSDPRVGGMLQRLVDRPDARIVTESMRALMEVPVVTFQFGPWLLPVRVTKVDGSYEYWDKDLKCLRAYVDVELLCGDIPA